MLSGRGGAPSQTLLWVSGPYGVSWNLASASGFAVICRKIFENLISFATQSTEGVFCFPFRGPPDPLGEGGLAGSFSPAGRNPSPINPPLVLKQRRGGNCIGISLDSALLTTQHDVVAMTSPNVPPVAVCFNVDATLSSRSPLPPTHNVVHRSRNTLLFEVALPVKELEQGLGQGGGIVAHFSQPKGPDQKQPFSRAFSLGAF